MIYAAYFAPAANAHPHAQVDDYRGMWELMHESLRRRGHRLVHLTDRETPSWGDDVFRVDVDRRTVVYSRDVAWAEFVRALPADETACMLEPDALLVRDVPELDAGADLALLRRDTPAGWWRLCRRSAAPFYDAVVECWRDVPAHQRVFHGDIAALRAAIDTDHGCRVEWRDWRPYGDRRAREPYLVQFKGASKPAMRRWAERHGLVTRAT